jgi:hypothetical protein
LWFTVGRPVGALAQHAAGGLGELLTRLESTAQGLIAVRKGPPVWIERKGDQQ